MNRIDRLNALLIHLQGRPRVTLKELEERFAIGRRTVFRDIRSLLEAGVPIGGDAGEGYFIVDGYHLPPVVFNKEEASAILMGSKFMARTAADAHTNMTLQNAMEKVKAVLKYADRAYLEQLEQKIDIRPGPRPHDFPNSHIAEIQMAIATNRLIEMTYYSHYKDETLKRLVEPLGMVFYSSRWHLIGYCRLRQDLRDFRADRIQKVTLLSETIDPSKHPNYMDFLNESLLGTDAKEATLLCSAFAARMMDEQKHFMGFVDEERCEDGKVRMKFVTPRYEYFAWWLMMFGSQVEVASPSELQGLVATYAKELLDHHSAVFV